MRIDPLIKHTKATLRKLAPYRRQFGIGVGIIVGLGFIGLFVPQTLSYSFSSATNCRVSPRLLPQLSRLETKDPFRVYRPGSIAIGRLHLYSHRICAEAVATPPARQVITYKERIFGWPFLGHSVRLQTAAYPRLQAPPAGQLLAPDGVLTVKLDQRDATFHYLIQTNGQSSRCSLKDATVRCDLKPLQLTYAQSYTLRLVRQFATKQPASVGETVIRTLTPTSVLSSSIAAGADVQQKPGNMVIQTDKKLQRLGTVTLVMKKPDGSMETIPTTAQLEDKAIAITFGRELPRKASFEVRLGGLAAEDGSGLVGNAYSLPFTTSGGPKVTGSNVSSRNVGTSQAITVNFSQQLLATQDPAPLVSLTVAGKAHPVSLGISGDRIIVTPQSPLPLCAAFTIKITGNVQSQHGVSGDSAWTLNSRAICYTVFSIGTSVRGRGLTAYQFGSRGNPVVYMGAMHGNEANSRTIMTDWFNELNANPGRLSGRSLVVIPAVNPDGLASGSRLNAHNVDLNRNFPAADWKSVVTSPESPQPSPAGGPSPLSEPESRAVAAYIQRVQPRAVFSFHSAAAVVEANEAGDSVSIAGTYAAKARYRAVPKSQSAPVFKYDTTGAMEDWMRDRLGQPAIVVELLSKTANEFSRNRDALWYTTGL